MRDSAAVLKFLGVPVFVLAMLWFAETHPGNFTNEKYLGGLLLLQIMIVVVWHYEKIFFATLTIVFLWAGTDVPLSGTASSVRWVFLGVGALVGVLKWVDREHKRSFEAIHLVALLCILSAAVSAMVSDRFSISLLKGTSLFLLFLYGSFGARLAVAGREELFFRGLVTACEVVTYLTAVLYFILRNEIFGNANSLGAVMGVAIVPCLFWGVLVADTRNIQMRRTTALCVAVFLLFSSISRAGILAAAVAVATMCIALHRGRMFVKGAFALVLLLTALAVVQPSRFDALVTSFTEDWVYKGKQEQGLLGSRVSPWHDTAVVIKKSPWFGSGFGTDMLDAPVTSASIFRTTADTSREHGNSYLGLLQYVGLLGIIPFAVLIFLVLRLIRRVCAWMWRTRSPYHYAIPLAFVCLAGLIHAIFEDWLFAVGYYLNVFFWTSAFILADLQPRASRQPLVVVRNTVTTPISAGAVALSANR